MQAKPFDARARRVVTRSGTSENRSAFERCVLVQPSALIWWVAGNRTALIMEDFGPSRAGPVRFGKGLSSAIRIGFPVFRGRLWVGRSGSLRWL